jgi:hypothetical protein
LHGANLRRIQLQAASYTLQAKSQKPKAESRKQIQLHAASFKLQANTKNQFLNAGIP